MSSTTIETVLRRDRLIIGAALAVLVALAWAYLFRVTAGMGSISTIQSMPGMTMPAMARTSFGSWNLADFIFMFGMWAVMMVGMMTPSVAPMVLIYAGVARQAENRGSPFPATGWFVSGYLVAWAAFSLLATVLQWGLEAGALMTPMMVLGNPILAGSLLIAAGIYQWTAYKDLCLSHCKAPLLFIQHHGGFRRDRSGALALGLYHGAYCVGCCWALIALLFVAGVMNLVWIAALAIIVLAEKFVPAERTVSRLVGVALLSVGFWFIASALWMTS